MSINFTVPIVPSSSYTTTIEKESYLFRFNWQERTKAWYMDISTINGEVLALASKLIPNTPLIRKTSPFTPTGNLYVVSNNNTVDKVPSRYNIGPDKDFSLVYFTEEELA